MPDGFGILSLLDLPSRVVAMVRDILGLVGIEPPGWLVLGIVLTIGIVLFAVFARAAWVGKHRAGSAIGAIAAGAVVVAIGWAWKDRADHPPTGQVRGTLGVPVPAGVEVWLLDHAQREVVPGLVDIATGHFLANYAQGMHEPPRSVMGRAPGCAERRVTLGRRQLQLGEMVGLRLDCDGGTG